MEKVGLIGLGVMGSALARNFERNGAEVVVFNRKKEVRDIFAKNFVKNGANFLVAGSVEDFCEKLGEKKTIFLMITAGRAVDAVIESLLPFLGEGDTIFDCGNSFFEDTERRCENLAARKINFVGMGVSGGEKGALEGPSMMPGGKRAGFSRVESLLEKSAARSFDGKPCVKFIGESGAGHFVKMVHNGIEYAVMELIAESFAILKNVGGFDSAGLAKIFEKMNRGELKSYLFEITAKILAKNGDLLEKISDVAGQKGTGSWTAETAMKFGVAVPTISAAVEARQLSGAAERGDLVKNNGEVLNRVQDDTMSENLEKIVEGALIAGILIAYAQGFALIARVSTEKNWGIDLAGIAGIWQGGCIIRAEFLSEIAAAFLKNGKLENLLADKKIGKSVAANAKDLREIVKIGVENEIGIPAFSSALSYFDVLRTEFLPTNLTAAQRDFFGAHGFGKRDCEGVFHENWKE